MKNIRLRRFLKTKKMFVCLLASYIAIFIFMSVFLSWMYVESDTKVKENLTEYNVGCVRHIGEITDNFCSDLESTAYQLKFLPLIDSAILGTGNEGIYPDYESSLTYMDKLKERYDFIVDAYLYLPEKNTVYSSCAIVDAKTYFDKIRKYKNYDYESWKNNYVTGVNSNKYFPVEEVDEYGISETNVITYSNSYIKKGTYQVAAYFNVLIDADKMLASIDEIQLLNNFRTFAVYDRDNNLVFKIGEETPEITLLEEYINNGQSYLESENKSIFYISSNINTKNWIYSVVTDSISFLEEMSGFSLKLKIIILFNIIIGILMVIMLTVYSYRPFKKIIADITVNKNNSIINPEIGEVELLKSIFSEQEKTMLEYEDIVIKQKRLLKENVLKNILMLGYAGKEDGERENINTDNEFMEFDNEMYGVAVLLLKEQGSHEFKNGIQLIEYAVSNMFSDVLNDNYNINIVGIEKGKIAIVVNLNRESIDKWYEDLQILGDYINTLMISEFEVELFTGVGNIYSSQEDLPKSFNEAQKALDFHSYNNENHVTFYKTLSDERAQSQYYYYPAKADSHIISSVILGDYNQVKAILDNINEINDKLDIESRAKYQLNSRLISFYKNVAVACSAKPEAFSEEDKKGSTSEIIKIIKNQYRMFCGGVKVAKSDKTEKTIEEIKNYIYEHFSENSLSVNEISEQFGITRQYLSTIFRSITGEKIVDFITKVRVENAKELLKNRSLNINQVAEKVGFINDISLIRAFKRVEGITPGYYRNNL